MQTILKCAKEKLLYLLIKTVWIKWVINPRVRTAYARPDGNFLFVERVKSID